MTQRILALDACTEACSVALTVGDEVLARYEVAPREHAHKLLPFIEQLLAEAGFSLTQLDAIAYGRGPGSFTGVRIGAATAQGLAYGAQLPMIPVSTLQAMAQRAYAETQQQNVVAAIDARMSEVYVGAFTANEQGLMTPVTDEQVVPPAQWQAPTSPSSWAGVGTGWGSYAELLQCSGVTVVDDGLLPSATAMLPFARTALANEQVISAMAAEPVYLRDKVTWKKLPGRE